MYEKFLGAFDHPYFENWNIVMNCYDRSYLDREPSNFIVVKESPQLTILKKSDMYVCHGGFNSAMESALLKVR